MATLYTIFGKPSFWGVFFSNFILSVHLNPTVLISLCHPGVLSLLGNGILLFVAYRKKSSLKPAEFFVVNLAISDLGMTLTLFPLAIPSAYAHMWVIIQVSTALSFLL